MQEGVLDYLLFDQEKASGIPWPRSDVRRFFTSAHDDVVESPLLFTKFSTEEQSVLEAKKKTRMRQERDQFRELHSFTIRQQQKQIDYSALQNTEGSSLVWKHVRKEAKNLRSESKQWQQCSVVPAVCVPGLWRTYLASRDHFDQRETALGSYADGDPAAETTTTTTTQAGSGDTLPPPSYRLFRRRLSSSSAAASTFCLIADSCSSSSCYPASCSYFRCYKDNAGPSRIECRRRVAGRWTSDLHEACTRTEDLLYQILCADERLLGKTWSRRLSSG